MFVDGVQMECIYSTNCKWRMYKIKQYCWLQNGFVVFQIC